MSALSARFCFSDTPRHPDTRLFGVREAFERSSLLGFQACIRAHIAIFSPLAVLRGLSPGRDSGRACGGQQTPNH